MNREEIENRIEACEIKANGYREVGNIKLADKYDNEKYKWEKLLSDLNLLNERKIAELLEYRKGYFKLEQENQKLKEENKNTYESNQDMLGELSKENKELHNKIDNAIEYINKNKYFYSGLQNEDIEIGLFENEINELLEILKDNDVDD